MRSALPQPTHPEQPRPLHLLAKSEIASLANGAPEAASYPREAMRPKGTSMLDPPPDRFQACVSTKALNKP